MTRNVSARRVAWVCATLTATLWITAGCNKGESGEGSSSGGTQTARAGGSSGGAGAAGGKAVYDANGCARCHALKGEGGRMGPDLTQVAANAQHTADWLEAHIKNPKTHNPGSRMPGYEGKIAEKDLKALSAYLASLK